MFPGYTMAELEAQARRRADMENSGFVTSLEVFDSINKSTEKLLEKIAALSEDLLIKKATLTTVAGTAEYELAADVMKLRKVALRVQDADHPLTRRQTDSVDSTTRQSWGYAFLPNYRARIATGAGGALVWMLDFNPPPAAVYTLPYEYIWGWTATSSSATKVELPFPEYIVLDVAIALLEKEKSSTTELVQEREILERRIEAWLEPKDHARAPHILDVAATEDWSY
jgi:hypothetical protein